MDAPPRGEPSPRIPQYYTLGRGACWLRLAVPRDSLSECPHGEGGVPRPVKKIASPSIPGSLYTVCVAESGGRLEVLFVDMGVDL